MREHPLTPMTDANLVRWLQAQTPLRVGLLRQDAVAAGVDAVAARVAALRAEGVRIAIADAIDNADLRTLGAACADLPLLVAGSGLALGLPAAYAARGWVRPDAQAAPLPAVGGHAAVLSGSCSTATNAQVAHWLQSGRPALRIDALQLAAGAPLAAQALAWAEAAAGQRAGADLRHGRRRRGQGRASSSSASSVPAPWSNIAWPRSQPACTSAAYAGWSLPAARPRARSCRRCRCSGCASARRSTPACRGRRPRAGRCCWR